MGQVGGPRLIETLVTQPCVKALDEPVLLRLAWCDVGPLDLPAFRPFEVHHTGQLNAIFTDHLGRKAAHRTQNSG